MFRGRKEDRPEPDWSKVRADLFNENGKWKYTVWLDYTGLLNLEQPPGSPGLSPEGVHWNGHEMAQRALKQATEKGTSGVVIADLRTWTLVVLEPPQGYPHLVRGSR